MHKEENMSNNLIERDVPKDIQDRLKAWQYYFKLWYFLYYFFGVVSIVSALIVAYMAFAILNPKILGILSLIAAISTALNYFLMPYKRAKGYVQAWRALSSASIEYKTDESVNIKLLHQALRDGEKYIANQYE